MERLTEHSKQTSHENGICCTHFRGPECLEVGGNCAMNCKWEEAAWSRLAAYEDTRLEPEEIDMDHEAAEQLRRLCRNCDIDRLEELAEADKNGRVVVLPRWKNEEERLERRRLMRIMADGAIDRLMENPQQRKKPPEEEPPKLPRDEEHLRERGEKGVGHAAVQPEAERAAGTGPPPDPRPRTAHSGPQAQRASIPRRGGREER